MEHDLQRVSSGFGKGKGLGFLVCHWIMPLSLWSDAGFIRKNKQSSTAVVQTASVGTALEKT
jgi:hypothetical protein